MRCYGCSMRWESDSPRRDWGCSAARQNSDNAAMRALSPGRSLTPTSRMYVRVPHGGKRCVEVPIGLAIDASFTKG